MLLNRLLCVSDICTFFWLKDVVNMLQPKYLAFLGDILYDGNGQYYLVGNKNSKQIIKAFQDVGLSSKIARTFLLNPKYIINKYKKYFEDIKKFIYLRNCLDVIL